MKSKRNGVDDDIHSYFGAFLWLKGLIVLAKTILESLVLARKVDERRCVIMGSDCRTVTVNVKLGIFLNLDMKPSINI